MRSSSAVIDHAPAEPQELTSEGQPLIKRPTPNMDNGRIIVPRNQRQISERISRWRRAGAQFIAHDLECAPANTAINGTGLHPHLGHIRLAQFGVSDGGDGTPEALVIDVTKLDARLPYRLLADERWATLVHFAQMEQRWHGWCHGLRIANLIDTCEVSKRIRPWRLDEHGALVWEENEDGEPTRIKETKHNLAVVCERELGIKLDKTMQNSHWDARKLSPEQLHYAGLDVLSLLDLWPRMADHMTQEHWETLDEKAEGLQSRSVALPEDGEIIGDEFERIGDMIKAARSVAEIDQVAAALPHMRLHYSSRRRVQRRLLRARRVLAAGKRPERPGKVVLPGWHRPF
jgi:hypothetical protein